MNSKEVLTGLLASSGAGITLDGLEPWDPQISDERFYDEVMTRGSLGLGEAYMYGWWNCADIAELFSRIMSSGLDRLVLAQPAILEAMASFRSSLANDNRQTIEMSKQVAEIHYDDRLFAESTYDESLAATCAYWNHRARTLEEAQAAKWELVTRKLNLVTGNRLLDIGSGWGTWLAYAARYHGAHGVGVTISEDQIKVAQERCKGLSAEFVLRDYREYEDEQQFDAITSFGMFEHTGPKNHAAYFDFAKRMLKPNGLFLLHCIVAYTPDTAVDPWLDMYVFPGGHLPTLVQITQAVEGKFVIEDVHNIGTHYDPTLMAWNGNFQRNRHKIVEAYGEEIARMYEYYLQCCAGAFRSCRIGVVQVVLSHYGVPGTYRSVR